MRGTPRCTRLCPAACGPRVCGALRFTPSPPCTCPPPLARGRSRPALRMCLSRELVLASTCGTVHAPRMGTGGALSRDPRCMRTMHARRLGTRFPVTLTPAANMRAVCLWACEWPGKEAGAIQLTPGALTFAGSGEFCRRRQRRELGARAWRPARRPHGCHAQSMSVGTPFSALLCARFPKPRPHPRQHHPYDRERPNGHDRDATALM